MDLKCLPIVHVLKVLFPDGAVGGDEDIRRLCLVEGRKLGPRVCPWQGSGMPSLLFSASRLP